MGAAVLCILGIALLFAVFITVLGWGLFASLFAAPVVFALVVTAAMVLGGYANQWWRRR